MAEVELVPLDDLEPAAYNPREADEERLKLLRMSLQKLGFILPLYADEEGHLLSGHQRLLSATQLGCQEAPVTRVNPEKKQGQNAKTLNVIFNRATNDMAGTEGSQELLEKMGLYDLQEKFDAVADKVAGTPEFTRCLNPDMVPLTDLKSGLTRKYDTGAVSMAVKMIKRGVVMNAVVNRDTGEVVNGNYRLIAAMELAEKMPALDPYPVVYISNAEAELAGILLNMISMKFTLERQYADDLRYGSFRRPSNVVEDLTLTTRIWVDGAVKPAHKTLENPEKFWSRFRRFYGNRVVDFGAGQRRQSRIFAAKGIDCLDWEPYPCDAWDEYEGSDKSRPHLPLARHLTDEFLERVRAGDNFDAIFLSAVLNSVPFYRDRIMVLAVVHSLCTIRTKVSGSCRHVRIKKHVRDIVRVDQRGKIKAGVSVFDLDYEKDVVIGDINKAPKVQKYETEESAERMLGMFWEKVSTREGQGKVLFLAECPKRVNPSLLKTALLHEFNLPYAGGESIDRGQEALDAFGERLGINFDKVEEIKTDG